MNSYRVSFQINIISCFNRIDVENLHADLISTTLLFLSIFFPLSCLCPSRFPFLFPFSTSKLQIQTPNSNSNPTSKLKIPSYTIHASLNPNSVANSIRTPQQPEPARNSPFISDRAFFLFSFPSHLCPSLSRCSFLSHSFPFLFSIPFFFFSRRFLPKLTTQFQPPNSNPNPSPQLQSFVSSPSSALSKSKLSIKSCTTTRLTEPDRVFVTLILQSMQSMSCLLCPALVFSLFSLFSFPFPFPFFFLCPFHFPISKPKNATHNSIPHNNQSQSQSQTVFLQSTLYHSMPFLQPFFIKSNLNASMQHIVSCDLDSCLNPVLHNNQSTSIPIRSNPVSVFHNV